MMIRSSRFLLALAALFMAAVVARAHGPYDSSAQLIILSDALELNATLGMDAAKQFLLNAGLSEADALAALASRGPSTRHELAVDLAARLFELRSGDQLLKPKRLQVITDGLEVSFTANYTGTFAGDVNVRARYFDGIEALKPGAFTAMDENRNIKGQAVFSRAVATADVQLAAATGKKPATNAASTPDKVSTVASPPLAAADGSAGSSPRPQALWIGGVVLVAGLLWLGLKTMNRSR